MSLLEQYEEQYAALIADITAQIGCLQQRSGTERREICLKIDTSLTEAQELLEQMGLEIRELNSAQRPSFSNKIKCMQVEMQRLQSEYRVAKDNRKQLKQGAMDHSVLDITSEQDYFDDVSISNDQRQRLLDNSELIERTGNRLVEGYRVALETEQLGTQVLSDLHHQRETIQNSRTRLRETNADLGRASRTLNSMMLRALREKAVLYVVGVCFVIAVGVSLYLTFSSPSNASHS